MSCNLNSRPQNSRYGSSSAGRYNPGTTSTGRYGRPYGGPYDALTDNLNYNDDTYDNIGSNYGNDMGGDYDGGDMTSSANYRGYNYGATSPRSPSYRGNVNYRYGSNYRGYNYGGTSPRSYNGRSASPRTNYRNYCGCGSNTRY